MVLKLHNSYTKCKEDFVPLQPGKVTMYTCGPTVYGTPHIGNYASFLMADLLRRWLEVGHGYDVKHVKNITDVGHLVADADSGEDKIEKQARQEKSDPLAIAKKYTQIYLDEELFLHMLEPFARPRATETIPEMIAMIQRLVDGGHAYETEDGVYFSVESFPKYGQLSGNTLEHLSAGARVTVDEKKKHHADFALWKKTVGPNANHILRWPSPWGDGFPGWHIECSAMSMKFLGETIDIHTGGEDNIFPHHECEIAQSECSTGTSFVRYWLHRRRIDIAPSDASEEKKAQKMSQKMSKSLGNVLVMADISQRGFHPLDLRYLLLSVHYRTPLRFSWKGLEDAHKARRKILEWMDDITSRCAPESYKGAHSQADASITKYLEEFSACMNDDLNASGALAAIFDLMAWSRTNEHLTQPDCEALFAFIQIATYTFGCFESTDMAVPQEVLTLVEQRNAARTAKDFAESDRLRDAIKRLGYEVRDGEGGQAIKKM